MQATLSYCGKSEDGVVVRGLDMGGFCGFRATRKPRAPTVEPSCFFVLFCMGLFVLWREGGLGMVPMELGSSPIDKQFGL